MSGATQVRSDAERVAMLKAAAQPPAQCSDEIPVAPARGPVEAYQDVRMVPVGSDGFQEIEERYRSGQPGMVRDNFDAMTDQALRSGGQAPFSRQEVDLARRYRTLYARVQSAGLKCSSAFDDSVAGSGRMDFMDVYAQDAARLRAMQAAIGDGVAKSMRRQRAVSSGGRRKVTASDLATVERRLITAQVLVYRVCIAEQALSGVLLAHGWNVTTKNLSALRDALCAALGRMRAI